MDNAQYTHKGDWYKDIRQKKMDALNMGVLMVDKAMRGGERVGGSSAKLLINITK